MINNPEWMNDYLEHKNHKYLSKIRKNNGKWRYIYKNAIKGFEDGLKGIDSDTYREKKEEFNDKKDRYHSIAVATSYDADYAKDEENFEKSEKLKEIASNFKSQSQTYNVAAQLMAKKEKQANTISYKITNITAKSISELSSSAETTIEKGKDFINNFFKNK